jgi:hypothetical protein
MTDLMRPPRPVLVTILAILHLLVGGIGLIVEGWSLVGTVILLNSSKAALQSPGHADPTLGAKLETPYFLNVSVGVHSAGVVLSLVLILAGVGLFLVKRWSYNLSVLYAWLSIAYQVVWIAFLVVVYLPVALPSFENAPAPANLPAGATPQAFREGLKIWCIGEVVVVALGLIYPLIVVVLTMLPAVKRAFRRPKAATVEGEQTTASTVVEPAPQAPGPGDATDEHLRAGG